MLFAFLCKPQSVVSTGQTVNFTQFTGEEGLFVKNIRCLFQDSKRRIWIGGAGSLAVYNGKSFKHYSTQDGLFAPDILDVTEDKNGRIWAATNRGLFVLNKKKFEKPDTISELYSQEVFWGIYTDTDGSIWAGGNRSIVHFDPDKEGKKLIRKYKPFNSTDHNGIRNFKRRKDGKLFAGGDVGYYLLEKDSFIRQNVPGTCYKLVELKNGKEWYSGWGQPIFQVKNDKLDSVIYVGGGSISMSMDKKGDIWLVTWENGVYRFDGKKFYQYKEKEGLNAVSFWSVLCDSEGNVWLGSFGNGLFKYSGERFTRLTEKNGLYSNSVNRIIEDTIGNLWLSGDNFASYYDQTTNQISNYNSADGQPFRKITGSIVAKNNDLLLLGYGGNGYQISKNKIKSEPWLGGFSATYDKFDRLCFGTAGGGPQIFENDKVVLKLNSGIRELVNSFVKRDSQGNLWFGNGMYGIGYSNYDTTLTFSSKNGFINTDANCIFELRKNEYLIGSDNGLYRCKLNANLTLSILDSLTAEKDLEERLVVSIHVNNGKMILGTSRGICVFNLTDYLAHKINFVSYTKDEGLTNSLCRVQFIDKKDKCWITTSKGVFIFDPSYEKQNVEETSNLLLSVKLFYKDLDSLHIDYEANDYGVPKSLFLKYDQNHLNFDFIGICHSSQSKVKYKYRLLGLDATWCPPTDKSEMEYSGLAPGNYTFEVVSCNNEGLWNKQPLAFTFKIEPPFWKKNWFRAFIVLLLILLVYQFTRWKERKLRKEKELLEEKVELRTNELKQQKELVEEKNKEITDSINYASRIQNVLLPSASEISEQFSDCFVYLHPKDIVSGDFYWSLKLSAEEITIHNKNHGSDNSGNELFFLAVCDSTGHGVPGAFMSLLNLNYLNEAVIEHNIYSPNEVFNYVRKQLISNISKEGQQDGFDGILFCYDKERSRITYVAAHNAPVMIRNKECIHLPYDKMPVGKGESTESFSLHTIELQKNDCIYLFTDGFADQFGGPKGKKFKYKQLYETLLASSHLSFFEQKSNLQKVFIEWKKDLEQVDDVCVIGIKI